MRQVKDEVHSRTVMASSITADRIYRNQNYNIYFLDLFLDHCRDFEETSEG